jgi:rod shape-determining protein MreD
VRKWLAAACVAFACAAAPLFAPQWWAQHGAFPDVAALAVLYLAVSGTPERAAALGVAIGLVRSGFSAAPLGLDAALYGVLGWSGAHFGRAMFQDRVLFKMAVAGVGVAALRALSAGLSTMTLAATPAAPVGRGMSFTTWASATLLAALATALAAPVAFAALSGSRVLAGFERRRKHDV